MNERIYQLLAKKMADELSSAERKELNNWLIASDENKREAMAIEKTWSISGDPQENITIDTEKAWIQLQQTVLRRKRTKVRTLFWSAAAAVVAMVGVAWLNLKSEMPNNPKKPMLAQNQIFETKSMARTIVLEDKTKVKLMPHSILKVNKGFNQNHRDVELNGIAHFTTQTASNHNFTVISNETRIIDISTSFTVNTNKDKIAVRVTEGTVQVKLKNELTTLNTDDSIWIMGEKLYLYQEQVTKKEKDEIKTEQLKPADKNLEFRNTELSEVVKIINGLYRSNISIGSESIKTCKFTSSFKNEDLSVIVDILRESFNLEVINKNGRTVLLGKGCN